MVLEALRLFRAFLEQYCETGVTLDADNTAATISLLNYLETEHRHLQARVLGTADPLPASDAANIISLKPFLEAKSHARPQI